MEVLPCLGPLLHLRPERVWAPQSPLCGQAEFDETTKRREAKVKYNTVAPPCYITAYHLTAYSRAL